MSVLSDRALSLLDYLGIDAESDELLERLMLALLAPSEELSLIAHGDGDLYPWQILTDPAVAPLWALPYAAQYTGGIMPQRRAGETDDDYLVRAREEIIHPRGMLRGGPTSLEIVARSLLPEGSTIRVVQRPDGDLWRAIVLVRTPE